MQIELTRHVDAQTPEEVGGDEYTYEYAYDMFRFSEGTLAVIARSYVDTPDQAHFLSVETNGHRRLMTDADLSAPLVQAACSYLRSIGKGQLEWLSGRGNGYEPVREANEGHRAGP